MFKWTRVHHIILPLYCPNCDQDLTRYSMVLQKSITLLVSENSQRVTIDIEDFELAIEQTFPDDVLESLKGSTSLF